MTKNNTRKSNGSQLGLTNGIGYTCAPPRLGPKPPDKADKGYSYVDVLVANPVRNGEDNDPIKFALRLTRKQGKILGVGSKVAFTGQFRPVAFITDDGQARCSLKQIGRLQAFSFLDVKEPKGKGKGKKGGKAKAKAQDEDEF